MRVIAVGCEYSGVSTLIDQLHQWGLSRGISHHSTIILPSPTPITSATRSS